MITEHKPAQTLASACEASGESSSRSRESGLCATFGLGSTHSPLRKAVLSPKVAHSRVPKILRSFHSCDDVVAP